MSELRLDGLPRKCLLYAIRVSRLILDNENVFRHVRELGRNESIVSQGSVKLKLWSPSASLLEGHDVGGRLVLHGQAKPGRLERDRFDLFERRQLLATAGHALQLFTLRPEPRVDRADDRVVALDRAAKRGTELGE